MTTISLVTPSLNQGKFIAEAIESVLNQGTQPFEYLVMDGGSQDGTVDILKQYGDCIRWVSSPDQGQSAAINQGWQWASGEVLGWLNADDRYAPGALAVVAAAFQAHPQASVIYGMCDYIGANGRVLYPYMTGTFSYCSFLLGARNTIPQPAAFVRRSVLEEVGWLDAGLNGLMDFDLWLRIGARHKILHVPVKLAEMRLHPGSKSVSSPGSFATEYPAIYRKLFASGELPEKAQRLERRAMSSAFHQAAHLAFWAGDSTAARRYALQALRLDPTRPRRSLLSAFFGDLLLEWMQAAGCRPSTRRGA